MFLLPVKLLVNVSKESTDGVADRTIKRFVTICESFRDIVSDSEMIII